MTNARIMEKAGRVVGSCQTEEQKRVAERFERLALNRTAEMDPWISRQAFVIGKIQGELKRSRTEA